MPTLTPGDGQDLLARYKLAWERRDVDAVMTLFREDAEYRPDPFEPAMVGDVAIREYWNQAAATLGNVEFDAERVWVNGHTVIGTWHGAVTRRATAERVRLRGTMTLELDDTGAVTRWREWTVSRMVGIDASFQIETGTDPGGSDGR
ncbi:MAG: nuclear transport factor 2 family protein [Chloroflexi bacterium]|nr:nuclear transport factor 2 family protein [Chloroflexota bacterium]